MSDKGRLRQQLSGLQRIRTWQLIVLLIIASLIAATFLRLNNIGMVERREAVISADEQGEEAVMIERLYALQRYVSAHMNTNLGQGVYLEKTFARDREKWQAQAYGDRNPNGNIFIKAQEVCQPRFTSWSLAYVQCVDNELAKFPSASEIASDTSRPRQETYIYSYASPLWSPDFAGWSVLVCLAILLVIIVRLVTIGILHLMLRRRYRNI